MAGVRVTHHIDRLAADMADIGPRARVAMTRVVKKDVKEGNRLARQFAKEMSGIHGKNYFKRLSAEMLDPLSGEFGPHDGGTPVGAGYRHGPPNMDLPRAADIIGPKLAKDAGDAIDGLFW